MMDSSSLNWLGLPNFWPIIASTQQTLPRSPPLLQLFTKACTPSPAASLPKAAPPPQVISPALHALPLDGDQWETEIQNSLKEISVLQEQLGKMEQHAQCSSSTTLIMSIVQRWMGDYVLRGGSMGARSGLPLLLDTSIDALPELGAAVEWIRLATDVLDSGTGVLGILYKNKILNYAQEELIKLKSQHVFQPEQLARFEELEKLIQYEKGLTSWHLIEQSIRSIKNIFSYFVFALSWIEKTSLLTSLSSGASALVGGFNAALYGLFFYQAHDNLKALENWSKALEKKVKAHTPTIHAANLENPKLLQEMANDAAKIIHKRQQRKQDQLSILKDKLSQKKMTREEMASKVKQFKLAGWQHFIKQFDGQKKTFEEFQIQLEEKMQVTLNTELATSLYQACLTPEPSHQQEQLVTQYLEEGYESWLKEQSEESLASAYVTYQSVLDPILKHALTEMVRTKQQTEKSLLKFKRTRFGIQFSAATVLCAVALTLSIIALASNPVGAAGLILALLTVSSIALSLGLLAGGHYLAYQHKPGLTAATLKGAYLRLVTYQALDKVTSIKEKIKSYVQAIRNQVALRLHKLPVIRQFFHYKKGAISSQSVGDMQTKRKNAHKWQEKALALKQQLEEIAWKDFARQAQLQVGTPSSSGHAAFDSLEALSHAVKQVDVELLSPDTKQLLEEQLGISVPALQQAMEKNPLAIKEFLRNFFNLDDAGYIKFIGKQQFNRAVNP